MIVHNTIWYDDMVTDDMVWCDVDIWCDDVIGWYGMMIWGW